MRQPARKWCAAAPGPTSGTAARCSCSWSGPNYRTDLRLPLRGSGTVPDGARFLSVPRVTVGLCQMHWSRRGVCASASGSSRPCGGSTSTSPAARCSVSSVFGGVRSPGIVVSLLAASLTGAAVASLVWRSPREATVRRADGVCVASCDRAVHPGRELRQSIPHPADPLGHRVATDLVGVRLWVLRAGVLPHCDGPGSRLAGRHGA